MANLPDNPFENLTLAEYGARLRRGVVSAEDVTRALLGRIEALDPKLGAYTFVARDTVLATARAIDALLGAGTDLGPLMGVPVAVKDLYFVEGMPLAAGSKLDVADIVRAEGPFIRALRSAGCILLGKTWTSEFALGGINFIQHVPWNPLDDETHRTPGGSSGGSAVALAAGLCAFALGSDTGGSVRMPAALCGTFGHKFSRTGFSTEGVFPLSGTLDSLGTLTASARDAALIWSTLKASGGIAPAQLRGLRLGRPKHLFYDELDPAVQSGIDTALHRLTRAGVQITDLDAPEALEFEAAFGRIVPIELIAILGRERVKANLVIFDPITRTRLAAALDQPAAEYIDAQRQLAALRAAAARRMVECDAWVTPTAPLVPTPMTECATLEAALAWNRRALRNTRPGNVFDQCGVSLPVRLPGSRFAAGLQLMAAPGKDARLLAIACALEDALSFPG
jgi:aspartyl-tRNA(Asn)/glutamyl-tRNA(Gln) amidotransferase subunit A